MLYYFFYLNSNLLIKKKTRLASQDKYFEADEIKKKIEKAKEEFLEMKKNEVKDQHKLEYANLEENMMLELEDFNTFWGDRLKDFDEKAKQIESLINIRHKEEYHSLLEEMRVYIPKIKPNHDYNTLKMTEIRLKKIDKFVEAEDLKQACEKIERQEAERLQQEKNDIFKEKALRLDKKHENEMNVALRKLQDEYNIIINQKEKEYAKLMNKFKTRKIELDLQQKHEKNENRNLNVIKQSKINVLKFFLYFIY